MQITSAAFENGGRIPEKYTCDGENINPPLAFFGVPDNAKSLALIMNDPDVPLDIKPDGNYTHWIVWNIPPDVKKIEEGNLPGGIEGKNSSGGVGYTGPCPPDKEHRYFFTLYALDKELNVDPETTIREELLSLMRGHIINSHELMGVYGAKHNE